MSERRPEPVAYMFHGDDGTSNLCLDPEVEAECHCGAGRTGWVERLYGEPSEKWERVGQSEPATHISRERVREVLAQRRKELCETWLCMDHGGDEGQLIAWHLWDMCRLLGIDMEDSDE